MFSNFVAIKFAHRTKSTAKSKLELDDKILGVKIFCSHSSIYVAQVENNIISYLEY
jgi:hypothetical protein